MAEAAARGAPILSKLGVLAFWSPLALTWAIMGVEVPVVSLAVARMPEATANLAALGAAFALAWCSETPIVNLTAASLRLGQDRESFRRMRIYAIALCLIGTAANAALTLTPALKFLLAEIIAMPPDLAARTANAYLWFLVWPACIGVRRFYQGQMIRHGDTRRVAYGTGVRLTSLCIVVFALSTQTAIPITGAEAGAAALMAGVVTEMTAAVLLARRAVRQTKAAVSAEPPPTFPEFWSFYWPLTVMMGLNLAVGAMVTAGLAKSRDATVALAAFPVAHGVNFIARALATSYQEAAIALLGRGPAQSQHLRGFAIWLAGALTLVLAIVAVTPVGAFIFQNVMDLPLALLEPAKAAFLALLFYPAATLWFVWSRARLTYLRVTGPIATATIVETAALVALMALFVGPIDMAGATAAGLAMTLSRIVANLWIERQAREAFKRLA